MSSATISTANDNASTRAHSIQRVFMVGCPRSGTTLVQSVLAAHRHVITFKESHFFDKGVRPTWRGYNVSASREQLLQNFCEENEIGSTAERTQWCRSLLNTTTPHDSVAWLLEFLDTQARGAQKHLWLEKTPDHVWRIPLLSQIDPAAKFIHIVRNPLATVASLRDASKTWGKQRSWLHCLMHWRVSLAYSVKYCGQAQHYFVFYEDFVNQPELETQNLLAWLELAYDNELLERRALESKNIIGQQESWKENTLGKIAPQKNTKVEHAPWFVRAYENYARCYKQLRIRWRNHCQRELS